MSTSSSSSRASDPWRTERSASPSRSTNATVSSGRHPGGLVPQHLLLVLGHRDAGRHFTGVLDHVHVAQVAEQVLDELGVVGGPLTETLDEEQRPLSVALVHQVDHFEQEVLLDQSEHVERLLQGDGAPGICGQLIEDPDGVTEATPGRPGDDRERRLGHLDTLLPGDAGQHADHLHHGRPAEVEALAARQDRRRDLVRLGGGQDEHGVGRRLLEGLEQRVEGLGGEHVHLVDDVHLHAAFHRREVDLVAQVADVVDAPVGGGVHLDDVHGAAPADGLAVRAGPIRVGRRLALAGVAVEGHGEDLGGGSLAGAAGTGEEIRVAHPVLVDGVDERTGHVLLPDDVLEAGRAVLAVEGDCHAPKDPW